MANFIMRRLLLSVPTLLGVLLVCFGLLHLADADPAGVVGGGVSGRAISAEALLHLRSYYGLDQPWYVQFARLLWRFLSLDLGTSWRDGRPIIDVLSEAMPVTLLLSLFSLLLSYMVAVPLGAYAAVRSERLVDQALTFVLFVLYSLPSFWVGTMALAFLASGRYLDCGGSGCFPIQGFHRLDGFSSLTLFEQITDVLWHLFLPLATLTYGGLAALSRYTRAALLDVMQMDYIRTARAKGLSERVVVVRHGLRNSLLPLVTLFGLSLPELVTGSVVVESIFGIRGMGLVTLEAIRLPDYPLVITNVAAMALLTVFGVLLSDILYALVDPRIRGAGRENR